MIIKCVLTAAFTVPISILGTKGYLNSNQSQEQSQNFTIVIDGKEVHLNGERMQETYDDLKKDYDDLLDKNESLLKTIEELENSKDNTIDDEIDLEEITSTIYLNGSVINEQKQNILKFNQNLYIPLDMCSEIIKEEVAWDKNYESIFIGKNPNIVLYLGEQVKPYKKYGNMYHQILMYPESGSILIAGQSYNHGIADSYIFGGTLLFNLDAKYSCISGLYAKTDDARPESGTIQFYDENDRLLGALELEADMLPREFSIDVTNVLQLRIEMSGGFTALVDTIIQ